MSERHRKSSCHAGTQSSPGWNPAHSSFRRQSNNGNTGITDHDPIYGSKAHFMNDQFDLSKAIRLAQKQPPVLATPVAIKTLQPDRGSTFAASDLFCSRSPSAFTRASSLKLSP